MIDYDIEIVKDNRIEFQPGSIEHEIYQNVITICTTLKGSVPMDRELGISPHVIDEPINIAKARISSEIIEALRRYEPRVSVREVRFEGSEAEDMKVKVKVRLQI